MGILSSLFGKPKAFPLENLSALQSAGEKLSSDGYNFAGRAGICLKKSGPSRLDITGMLAGAGMPARYELATDEYGCTWIILKGDLSSTVSSAITACRQLNVTRHGGEILCIAFEFSKDDRKVYWIYNKKGRFYPFVPQDSEHDIIIELKMKEAGTDILPIEGSVSNWYPLWGMPF
jgi:hypothetical protein